MIDLFIIMIGSMIGTMIGVLVISWIYINCDYFKNGDL